MMETLTLTKQELTALLEHSSSLPTGAYIGKRWKCWSPEGKWLVGEYVPHQEPGYVGIKWYQVVLRD